MLFTPVARTLICLSILLPVCIVYSRQVFIDTDITTATSATYNPEKRSADGGSFLCYEDPASAFSDAAPGDSIYIRETTFGSTLTLPLIGKADSTILVSAYPGDTVRITGVTVSPALNLSDARYLIVAHLVIDSVRRWVFAANTHHCVLRNNIFLNALDEGSSSKTGIFFELSTYNRIENNTIDNSTEDNLALHNSDRNLVIGNTISNAIHTTWTIKCGSYNILRRNHFSNPIQKIGEIFDCKDAGSEHQFFIYDSTRHNVVEHNIFSTAVKYYSTSGGNGIQYAGQMGIIRRNIFYDCNAGFGLQRYEGEAEHVTKNRIYHNVFYKNECGGIAVKSAGDFDISDNIFMNNILLDNLSCEKEGNAQIIFRDGPVKGSLFKFNFLYSESGNRIIGELFRSDNTLSYFETNNKEFFANNTEANPMFRNPAGMDFTLKKESPCIDAGTFLTATTAAGTGKKIPVQDPYCFCDGFGIPGVSGDTIRIEGVEGLFVVVVADYTTGILTLDKDAEWSAGKGVSLYYSGLRPDAGVFEYTDPISIRPGNRNMQSAPRKPNGRNQNIQLFNIKGVKINKYTSSDAGSETAPRNKTPGVYILKTPTSVEKALF